MDAKLNEMVVAAFTNVEDLKVELLKRFDAAKTREEQDKIAEVVESANDAYGTLGDLRVLIKKNF